MRESDLANTKGDYSAFVKDLAAEIEAMEGRKIELIKRRILRDSASLPVTSHCIYMPLILCVNAH